MTVYTAISKEIGWEPRTESIPSLQRAETLLSQVRDKNRISFKKVFLINRFAGLSNNPDEEAALAVIHQAFCEGRAIFEAMEVES